MVGKILGSHDGISRSNGLLLILIGGGRSLPAHSSCGRASLPRIARREISLVFVTFHLSSSPVCPFSLPYSFGPRIGFLSGLQGSKCRRAHVRDPKRRSQSFQAANSSFGPADLPPSALAKLSSGCGIHRFRALPLMYRKPLSVLENFAPSSRSFIPVPSILVELARSSGQRDLDPARKDPFVHMSFARVKGYLSA
jgi:hypothetical protein